MHILGKAAKHLKESNLVRDLTQAVYFSISIILFHIFYLSIYLSIYLSVNFKTFYISCLLKF
ncbi:hypothetical protein ACMBCN_00740 [Candidatus Liberibacter asiaticus]